MPREKPRSFAEGEHILYILFTNIVEEFLWRKEGWNLIRSRWERKRRGCKHHNSWLKDNFVTNKEVTGRSYKQHTDMEVPTKHWPIWCSMTLGTKSMGWVNVIEYKWIQNLENKADIKICMWMERRLRSSSQGIKNLLDWRKSGWSKPENTSKIAH